MANGILSGGLPPGVAGFAMGRAQMQQDELARIQQQLHSLTLQEAAESAPLKRAMLRAQVKQMEDNLRMRQEALSETPPSAPQAALAQGAQQPVPDIGPTVGNASRIPAQPAGLLSPQQRLRLLSGDPGLKALTDAELSLAKPMAIPEGGSAFVPGRGFIATRPKLGEGMQPILSGGEVTGAGVIPGFAEGRAQIAGAERAATEAAAAPYQPPIVTRGPGNREIFTPRPAYAAPFLPKTQGGTPLAPSPSLSPVGGITMGPTAEDLAGATARGKERGEAGVKYETGIVDAGQKARANLTQLQILAPNLEKLPTGPMYPLLIGGASYFKQFGIDVGGISKDLGSAQATDAILKQLALKSRDPAGGGMPGNMSDADREFLVNSIPGLAKLPDGNRQLIEILSKIEQRKIDEASIVNRMQAAGKSSNEIREALGQFANSRPMFSR